MGHAGHGDEWTPKLVELRLEEAGKTLFRIPSGRLWPAQIHSGMPDVVHDWWDVYNQHEAEERLANATPAQIAAMDEAFGWLSLIPDQHMKPRIVTALRSIVNPRNDRHIWTYRRLGRQLLNCHHDTVIAWHSIGLSAISRALSKNSISHFRSFSA